MSLIINGARGFSQVQCLLFVVEKSSSKASTSSSHSKSKQVKLYVLLPSIVEKSNPKICDLFIKHNIQLLSNELSPPLSKHDEIKVVELILRDKGVARAHESKSSPRLEIYVESSNEGYVKKIFGRDVMVFKMKFDSGRMLSVLDKKNESVIKCILSIKADIKLRDSKGGTLLHLAVIRNHDALTKLLIGHGATVDTVRNNGSTPLHLAVQNGSLPIVKILIKNGACMNARQKNGATSLFLAVEGGFLPIYKLLLSNGASIAPGKFDGTMLFHAAVKNGNIEIFKDLLQRGVDIDTPVAKGSMKGCTPLYLAVENGHTVLVKRLLQLGADVNAESHKGQSVLCAAVNKGYVETVKCILRYKPNLDCNSSKKALEKLVLDGKKDAEKMLKLLMQYGFKVCSKDVSNFDFVLQATVHNYVDVVKQLLELGLNVQKNFPANHYIRGKFPSYFSLLHIVCMKTYNGGSMIQLLIDHGANVNAKCNVGSYEATPLSIAVIRMDFEAVQTLLANGATVNCENVYAATNLVKEPEKFEVGAKILKALTANATAETIGEVLCGIVVNQRLKGVEVLLKVGAPTDSRMCLTDDNDNISIAAFSVACMEGNCDIVKLFIVNNANLESKDEGLMETTPLMVAAENDSLSVVNILLMFGARIDALSKDGRSMFPSLVIKGHKELFELLLSTNFFNPNFIVAIKVWEIFNENCLVDDDFMRMKYQAHKKIFQEYSKILERHVIKVKAAGIDFDDKSISLSWPLTEADVFWSNCEAEIASMKAGTVAGTEITFYDILVKDVDQLAGYARNSAVQQLLTSSNYKNQFPIYASVIECQIHKGTQRRRLLDVGIKICRRLFCDFSQLPLELGERIVGYLTNQNLAVLKYAVTNALP